MLGKAILLAASAGGAAVALKFVKTGADVNSENALKFSGEVANSTASTVREWVASTEQGQRLEKAAQEADEATVDTLTNFAREKGQAWNKFVLQVQKAVSKFM